MKTRGNAERKLPSQEWGLQAKTYVGACTALMLSLASGCGPSKQPSRAGYEAPVPTPNIRATEAAVVEPTTPVEFYFYINADNDIMGVRDDGTIAHQGEMSADQLKGLYESARVKNFGLHIYLDRGSPLAGGDPIDSESFDGCGGEAPTVAQLGETDSTDPKYVKELLAKRCYADAKRFVVFWSHGNGFRVQQDFDYSPDSKNFHISTLLAAIPDRFAEGVLFDSCSMGSLEISSLLVTKAKWMLSSQFELPNEGLQYGTLPTLLGKDRDTLSILREVLSASEAKFKEMDYDAPLVLVDLAKVPALIDAFKQAWTETAATREKDYDAFRSSVLRGENDGDLYFFFGKYAAASTSSSSPMKILGAALDSARGSLHFALPKSARESDADFDAIATVVPELFRTWSEKFPSWREYSLRSRPVQPPATINVQSTEGELL